jgi:5-methyltetrahydropteroyltriglutamate--homocysteine methyltransferase
MPGLLPTTVIGSYPQPDWLVDREMLRSRLPPRVLAREVWRVPPQWLEQAQDDATLLAIREMEQAGLDLISDGEIRRESYSNRFANALAGIDLEHPGEALSRTGKKDIVPRIVGPIRRVRPVEVRDLEFLRRSTDRAVKITVPGPFTMSQQAVDEHYHDPAALAMAFAAAVNEELHDLIAAGADVVQIDEPYLQSRTREARDYALPAIERALRGIGGTTALHTCFGYAHYIKDKPGRYEFLEELASLPVTQLAIEAAQPRLDLSVLERLGGKIIVLGVIDLADPNVETTNVVAERVRAALRQVPPERLVLAPDCGMKYLGRATAFGKLRALVEGARIVRTELAGVPA